MQVSTLLADAAQQLAALEAPRFEAEILLADLLGRNRAWLRAFPEHCLAAPAVQDYLSRVSRRKSGEPVAYITGHREFWSLDLRVAPCTLIPRPETEVLVSLAIARAPQGSHVADLGTGTGAVALALKHERPDLSVVAVDVQAEAVALAIQNARAHSLDIEVRRSDWFSALTGQKFQMIVANPPYIDADDHHLGDGDVRFEPRSALVAAEGGMADLAHIIGEAPGFLAAGGWLLVEHGWEQGEAVRERFQWAGFDAVSTWHDLGGRERVTGGRWGISHG